MNPNPELVSVRLKCSCPPNCICRSSEERDWHHEKCHQESYITEKGDIYCNQKGCSSYFIKDASFQCQLAQEKQTYYKFQSAAKIITALAMAIQAADYTLKDNDLINFITTINSEVAKRWNQ